MSDPLLTPDEGDRLDAVRRLRHHRPILVLSMVAFLVGGVVIGVTGAEIVGNAAPGQVQPPLPCTGRVP